VKKIVLSALRVSMFLEKGKSVSSGHGSQLPARTEYICLERGEYGHTSMN